MARGATRRLESPDGRQRLGAYLSRVQAVSRPHTFCWVWGAREPWPQVIFDDSRVGCDGLKIIPGSERKLSADDGRSLDELSAAYPAPEINDVA